MTDTSDNTPDHRGPRPAAEGANLYAPFRPRRGRFVAMTMAIVSVVLFVVIAFIATGPGGFSLPNQLATILLGILIAGFLWRYVGLRADPDPQGILVRNLILTRRVEWPQVEAVRFHGGAAWPVLALHDGDEVSVMAVQKADGDSASTEATRLATLVEQGGGGAHSATGRGIDL